MIDDYNQFANCNKMYRAGGTAVFMSQWLCTQTVVTQMVSVDTIKITIDFDADIFLSIISIYHFDCVVPFFLEEFNQVLLQSKHKNLALLGI